MAPVRTNFRAANASLTYHLPRRIVQTTGLANCFERPMSHASSVREFCVHAPRVSLEDSLHPRLESFSPVGLRGGTGAAVRSDSVAAHDRPEGERELGVSRPNAQVRRIWPRYPLARPLRLASLLLVFSVLSVFSLVNCLAAEPQTAEQIEASADAALAGRDFAKAEPLLRRQIELQPRNFVPLYNLACVCAAKGNADEAGLLLVRAVENGFDDYRKLTRDPDLAGVRGDANYKKLVENWAVVLEARRDANLELARKVFDHPDDGASYTEVFDEKRRLIYRSAFDPAEFKKAREELEGLGDWAERIVFPGLWDPKEVALDPWVVIVLPSRRDFTTWLIITFGPAARTGFSTIGGSYIHEQKQLVSQDLGSTLRHEFFHVLHWRDCTRKGQTHEYWVQEGLASLVEDVDVPKGASYSQLKPVPSWRTNIAQRRERSNTLMPLEKFCVQPREKFLSSLQLANYAEARTIFLYLYELNQLQNWYGAYGLATAATPPAEGAGIRAFEQVFDRPIRETDKDFRKWVRTLPEVAEDIRAGMASLGVEVETGTGDGVTITSIIEPPRRGMANIIPPLTLKGVKGELRVGDVITAVDGAATRDVAELVRVLGVKKPGDVVVVTYRRRANAGEATIRLIAKP